MLTAFCLTTGLTFCKRIMSQKEKSLILEIGGGFGGLGYYLHKINANCTYIDLDIPRTLLLQNIF